MVIPSSVYYKGKKYTVTQIADHETYYQDSVDTTDGNYVDVDMAGWRYYRYDRVDGKEFPGNVNWISGSPITKVILPSTLNKLLGRLETNAGRVVFKGTQPPTFKEKYRMSVKTIVVPKGTYDVYKDAIGKAYDNDEGDYYIWNDTEKEMIEE